MNSKKIVIISGYSPSLVNFRGDLIRSWVKLGYEVYAVGPEKDCESDILALGVKEFHSIKVNRTGANVFSDVKYVIALRKYLKQIKADVTLGYTIKPAVYGALAAKLAGVKNINSMITGAGFLFASNSIKAKVLKFMSSSLLRIGFGCADKVIFQNRDDLSEFVSAGLVSINKCNLVNGSGVNMERFAPSALPSRITFLMMARLLYSKGTLEYLKASEIVKKKYPEVRFMIIGRTEDLADCIPQDELDMYFGNGIVEQISYTNEVPKYLSMCSVYVLPSYREGTPRSVLEAMAMGRPIITTDTPGCRETVVPGDNGFLIPVKSVESLVEKMEWFITNQDKIEQMGIRSYQICKEKFEVSKVNETMNQIMGLSNVS